MRKLIFLSFALLTFLYISCDNGGILSGTTIIEGRVLEYGTNEPVENATVTLYERVSTGTFSGTDLAVETIITDASGRYSFESEGLGLVGVNATHDNYFEPNMITYDGIVYNDKNNVDIVIDPHAWLKLHIKNVNPFDENDLLTSYSNPIVGASPENSYGQNIDFYTTQKIRGNKNKHIIWWVTKNNIYQEFRDTIYCEGHKTTEYELFY